MGGLNVENVQAGEVLSHCKQTGFEKQRPPTRHIYTEWVAKTLLRTVVTRFEKWGPFHCGNGAILAFCKPFAFSNRESIGTVASLESTTQSWLMRRVCKNIQRHDKGAITPIQS